MNRKIRAYTQDQMSTTHPIAADISDVATAKINFDGIAYAKGTSAFRQLVAWIREDAFYEGAHHYLVEYQFGVTNLQGLFVALEGVSQQMLSSWKNVWLGTSGPLTLSALWITNSVGTTTDFTLHQGDEACNSVLRPHHVTVSTRRAATGAFERTYVFDARIGGDSTPIGPEGAAMMPSDVAPTGLVVVNGDDLTYAISRLDERSTDVTLAYVGTIGTATARAVI